MSVVVTADWFQLDSYYRKIDLYTMNWLMDEGLDNMIVSGAPYGGPIAVVRDRKQFVRVMGSAKPLITIYNGVGSIISKIGWNSGVLVHMGWSDGEQLLCVQESGDVLIYDMFGAYQKTFNMGQEVRDTKVCKAQLFPTPLGVGLAVITTTNRMFMVSNVSEPKVRPAPDIPRANEPISCWCVTSSGFLVCRDKEIFKCQLGESRAILMRPEIKNPYTQILSIVSSQNGKHVALFTDSGILCIGTSDFKTMFVEIDTGYIKQPKELIWCGSQAVIAHWDDTLCMYDIKGKSDIYPYDGPFHLIQEMDCVRVISERTHELIQKVPFVLEKIFRIDSTAPASYLVEASRQFNKGSHKADEYIRLVKSDLPIAVQDCIEAASFEFRPEVQKELIRAAQFGKCFIMDPVLTDLYVKTCRWLRVLNAVRDPKVAIPLTSAQMSHLGERILLDRLIWRRLHCLAGHIASYLQLKDGRTRVLSHWACYKVTQPHLDNESAAREIGEKLRNVPGISYTTIAMKAAEKGRKALAIKILEYETHSKLQVPLLLYLGEGKTALLKATASGDTDLVYTVLLHLKEKMGKRDFELTIRSRFALAHALYIKYCARHNREALRQVYVQDDEFPGQAASHLRDALQQANPGSVEASLISARECYKKGKNDLGVAICEDARKLCKQHSSLQETYGAGFIGLSLHDTVKRLLDQGEVKLADKLRAEYKMPDRRYWWLRILTLAEKNDWEELDKFSKWKKSPVGYEPFVDACLKQRKNDEALKYLPRCRDDIKVKYYVKAGFFEEAAEVAFEQKDKSALLFVQNKCPMNEPIIHEKISTLLERLATKK